MRPVNSQDYRQKWLSSWLCSSRIISHPHLIVIVTISTLVLIAVMHEHLLWALTAITGYSTASFPPNAPGTVSNFNTDGSALRFSQDGTFKISVLEDLHFGEAEDLDWGPRQDEMTLKVMQTVLDIEEPQLVVLNGDLITGENTFLENSTDYLDMIVKPLVEGGYYWASAYGNHDQGYNLSSKAILEKEQSYRPSSLTRNLLPDDDDVVGVTNYFLPVFHRFSPDPTIPALILWFFDSQGGSKFQQHDPSSGEEIAVPGVVHPKVVEWFKRTSLHIKSACDNKTIPSLAFVHIPVSAMLTHQQTGDGVDPHREPGINDDNPIASQGPDDKAFINTLAETEGLLAVFSGHDHGNDFCHPYLPPSPTSTSESSPPDGNTRTNATTPLFFCFGRHTGYGGYGHWMRGSRQVVFNPNLFSSTSNSNQQSSPSIETWIRLEDGSISGHVFLNSTYGEDLYPKVRNDKTTLPSSVPPVS